MIFCLGRVFFERSEVVVRGSWSGGGFSARSRCFRCGCNRVEAFGLRWRLIRVWVNWQKGGEAGAWRVGSVLYDLIQLHI